MKLLNLVTLACLCILMACTTPKAENEDNSPKETPQISFAENLIFYTSFDQGTDADYAKGDGKIYTAPNFGSRFEAVEGLSANPNVGILEGKGKMGNALEFIKKDKPVVFYSALENLAFDSTDWDVTISFWMQLDPVTDLEPGFCDPIQISDVGFADAGLWVDFTKENPRDFRMGIIGERSAWDPEGIGSNDNPEFTNRLVVSKEFPFSRESWTHIALSLNNLNGENAQSDFYVNGQLMGSQENMKDPFYWDEAKANFMLGLNYVGLLDEISVFDKGLNAEEVGELFGFEGRLK